MKLDSSSYNHLKTALWAIRGPIKSSHLDQGLAHGFGFPDYHALQTSLKNQETVNATFNLNAFLKWMKANGYRPGEDVRDPQASLFDVATTTLSIVDPSGFLEQRRDHGLSGNVIRLDVTDAAWKLQVARYREMLTRLWGPDTEGYGQTGIESAAPHVFWRISLPALWKQSNGIVIDPSMISVWQGRSFPRQLDQSDASRIKEIEAKTGETPAAFFSRVLTDVRPHIPGARIPDLDPVEDVRFNEDGLRLTCWPDNRRNIHSQSGSVEVCFEKIPYLRFKTSD